MNKQAKVQAKEVFTGICKRIRRLRKDKGFSLDELSKRTGFAKSYLSQIENLKREPPISTLSQIAHILEIDLLFLLTGETQNSNSISIAVVRKEERKTLHRPFGSLGYVYESITYKKPDRLIEGYIATIGPEFPPDLHLHEGQEMIYVLEGSIEFIYDGETYFIEKGDCVYIDSNRPHTVRSVGEKLAKLLVSFATKKD